MRPHELLPVDEESRGAAYAGGAALGDVGVHGRAEAAVVEAAGEGHAVEADLDGVLYELLAREARLVGEETVMVRPELAEGARAAGGFGRGPRAFVRGEREILEDEPDLARELVEDLVQRPLDALAVRSLVI